MLDFALPCDAMQGSPLNKNKKGAGTVSTLEDAGDKPIKLLFLPFEVPGKVYTAFEAVVLLASLAAVDAGFSGDWVRYGFITPGDD